MVDGRLIGVFRLVRVRDLQGVIDPAPKLGLAVKAANEELRRKHALETEENAGHHRRVMTAHRHHEDLMVNGRHNPRRRPEDWVKDRRRASRHHVEWMKDPDRRSHRRVDLTKGPSHPEGLSNADRLNHLRHHEDLLMKDLNRPGVDGENTNLLEEVTVTTL